MIVPSAHFITKRIPDTTTVSHSSAKTATGQACSLPFPFSERRIHGTDDGGCFALLAKPFLLPAAESWAPVLDIVEPGPLPTKKSFVEQIGLYPFEQLYMTS